MVAQDGSCDEAPAESEDDGKNIYCVNSVNSVNKRQGKGP
jgi:hypothetical protein